MTFKFKPARAGSEESAAYSAEYDIAYLTLALGGLITPEYISELTEDQRAAWIDAATDVNDERSKA